MSKQRILSLVLAGVALAAVTLYAFYVLQQPPQAASQNVEISVAWDGTVLFNGKPVGCEELHARLREMDPAADPADAKEQDARRCVEEKRDREKSEQYIRVENGVRILALEGGTVLRLKNGDMVSVNRSGKARWNGNSVTCAQARAHVLATLNVRPYPDQKLKELVPCKD